MCTLNHYAVLNEHEKKKKILRLIEKDIALTFQTHSRDIKIKIHNQHLMTSYSSSYPFFLAIKKDSEYRFLFCFLME